MSFVHESHKCSSTLLTSRMEPSATLEWEHPSPHKQLRLYYSSQMGIVSMAFLNPSRQGGFGILDLQLTVTHQTFNLSRVLSGVLETDPQVRM